MKQSKQAKPYHYNDDRVALLLAAFEAGATRSEACGAAGICTRTYDRWMHDAKTRPDEAPTRELPGLIAKARAVAAAPMIASIRNAAQRADNPDWRAGAWFLERSNPEEWGPRQQVKVDATVTAEITRGKLKALSDDELEAIALGADLPMGGDGEE